MNLSLNVSIPAITVFVQGLLSFFSPCVLPLIPVYMGYLSGGTRSTDELGNIRYDKKKVLINTLFFVIGVSFAFFLLGFVMTTVGKFFSGNQLLFARIGGIIVIMFGLYQLGVFGDSRFLGGEHRLPVRFEKMSVSPLTALLMGFVLSFAWTPCVGPALSTVLIMASTAGTSATGFMLIAVYTLGYVIPFILVGMFTTQLLDYLGRHRDVVKYTVKIGGALMILMGILMFTGSMNRITGYMSSISGSGIAENATSGDEVADKASSDDDEVAGEDDGGADGAIARKDAGGGDASDDSGKNSAGDTTLSDNKVADSGGVEAAGDGNGKADAGTNGKPSGADSANEAKADADDAGSTSGTADSDSSGTAVEDDAQSNSNTVPAPDFLLTDQNGVTHSLSDYRGKILFLNFWATWCPPCRAELPDIQALYEEYAEAGDDSVAFVGVTFPDYGDEKDVQGIEDFLEDNDISFPVLMDESTSLAYEYYITAFPTTFIIDQDGNVLGYIPGAMSKDIMKDVIDQAKEQSGM
jgi:cytochrome c-type biogenesis protein